MAEIQIRETICLQNQIIKLYDDHHQHCEVIPEELRASLNRALESLRTLCNSSRNTPSDNELQIVPFPGVEKDKPGKRKRPNGGPARKLARKPAEKPVVDFIKNAPTPESWNLRLVKIGIGGSAEHPTHKPFPGRIEACDNKETALFTRAQGYAQRTASYIASAEDAESICRFQLFCFLSYCTVLKDLKHLSCDEINSIMRGVVSDGSDEYLTRLRNKAKMIHMEVVIKLVEEGWTITQATLLMFFCAPQRPYEYPELSVKSCKLIVNSLKERKYTRTECEDINFSIATTLIEWEPLFNIGGILGALGYPRSLRDQLQTSVIPPSISSPSHARESERLSPSPRVLELLPTPPSSEGPLIVDSSNTGFIQPSTIEDLSQNDYDPIPPIYLNTCLHISGNLDDLGLGLFMN